MRPPWLRIVTAAAAISAWATACTSFGGDDPLVPPSAGDPDASDARSDEGAPPGTDANEGGDAGPCPTGVGPAMTVIAASSDRSICVDRTEVTSAQYAAFITATSTLDPWKDAVPKACKSLALAALDAPDDGGDLPRVTVSFCSAAYFCAAQGKRICGSLADGGAVVVEAGAGDPPLEWEGACANGQDRSFYPWGTQAPEPAIAAGCLTKSSNPDANAPRAAGGAPQCAPSPTEGPFDMIGNVWEWVNLRSDGAGVSYTAVRGGSYAEPTVIYGCASPHGIDAPPGAFAAGHAAVGFRCCADPKP